MVRVAMLKRRIRAGDQAASPDGLTPAATLAAVAARVHELIEAQHRCFLDDVQPRLAAEGIVLLRPKELGEEQRRFLEHYVRGTVLPILTPLAVDPAHPFPYLGNRSVCLVASIRAAAPSTLPDTRLSVIHIPGPPIPRFIALPDPDARHVFILLEDAIRLHLPAIYTGYDILSSHAVRITRDADLQPPGRPEDLLTSIEESLRERRLGTAVRLQYDGDLPPEFLSTLLDDLELQLEDLYEGEGFAAFSDLLQLYAAVDIPRLKDRPLPPASRHRLRDRARHLERPARPGRPRAPPLPRLRRGHALRPGSVGRSEGARHQDDAVPREPGLADRPRPARRRRERQGGRGPGGAAGALRRGGERPLGPRAGGGRGPRGLRPPGLQDPLQGVSGRPPGERWDPALLPPRDRQLQCPHRGRLQRSRIVHEPGVVR